MRTNTSTTGSLWTRSRPESIAAHGRSSPETVAASIIEGILAGQYAPGQRLIEADLATRLGVSRGPIREALKLLAADGIVILNRHRGAYIRAMTRKEVVDLLCVIEVLVGLAARQAARNIRLGDNRARLERTVGRLLALSASADDATVMAARNRFYGRLVEISGNLELARMLPVMQVNIVRLQVRSYQLPRNRKRRFENYRQIAAAVLDGQIRRAERLMRLHIRRARLDIQRLSDAAFSSEA
jgi:DNA-binding GntR family transcriptional regulator